MAGVSVSQAVLGHVRWATERAGGGRSALVPLGYIFAVIMPIVGLILGIIAATRPRGSARRNGPWIIVLSAVAFAIWFAVIVNAAQRSSREAVRQVNEQFQQSQERAKQEGEAAEQKIKRETGEAEQKAKREAQASEEKLKQEQQANEEKFKSEQQASEEKAREGVP